MSLAVQIAFQSQPDTDSRNLAGNLPNVSGIWIFVFKANEIEIFYLSLSLLSEFNSFLLSSSTS